MKTLPIALAILLTSTSVQAFDPYAYVRAQFSGSAADSGDVSASSTRTAVTGGYMFHNNFGVESTLGLDRKKITDNGTSASLNEFVGTIGLRAQTELGNNLIPYVVASAYSARAELKDGADSASASDEGFAFSGGVEIESSDNLVVGVQATKFVDGPTYYGVQVGYNFKKGLGFSN